MIGATGTQAEGCARHGLSLERIEKALRKSNPTAPEAGGKCLAAIVGYWIN